MYFQHMLGYIATIYESESIWMNHAKVMKSHANTFGSKK